MEHQLEDTRRNDIFYTFVCSAQPYIATRQETSMHDRRTSHHRSQGDEGGIIIKHSGQCMHNNACTHGEKATASGTYGVEGCEVES